MSLPALRVHTLRPLCGLLCTAALCLTFVLPAAAAEEKAAEEKAEKKETGGVNQLTPSERKSGWKLLFDGTSTDGWRNYREDGIGDGWKVEDGALVRAEKNAGDIISKKQYGSFELSLEYQIAPGGNSGVMYHVTEEGEKPWNTGPEVQLLDNAGAKALAAEGKKHESQLSGWLYQLYPSEVDATRPAGEWNQLQIRVTPQQCEHNLNGVRYTRYVKGSKDWNDRVAQSKFADLPNFGKPERGHICLQDHGARIAFRNVKIRELPPDGEVTNPVDGSLALQPVPAFPNVEWSGWAPISDEGKAEELRPIVLTNAGDGSNRVFIATQRGVIHVIDNHQHAQKSQVFLDISSQVTYQDKQNEEGFLGLTFHPNYKENGQFVVYYSTTEKPQTSIISRFRVSSADPNRADPDSEEELLRIDQPYWNHNGGTVVFGPDGYLYIGLGDGGAGNDPHGNGQNLGTLLGSILRIDVDHRDGKLPYAIPADNPFVGKEGARGEIWAYGFRNVWRISFDSKTGELWAADVGQNLWEEINIVERGANYGWNLRESAHPFGTEGVGPREDLVEPIWEYDHEVGKSITGGVVYRGKQLPELKGTYLYADYVTGHIWALKYNAEKQRVAWNKAIPSDGIPPIISFGEDEQGEVYFTSVVQGAPGIYKFQETTTGQ